MHISAVEEYGLRCALQLASLPEGEVLAASQIAEREGISVQYASKIMHLFRKSGLVSAERGKQGGFRLSKAPDQLSLRVVFASLKEEEEKSAFCGQFKGLQSECVHIKECSVRPVWDVLSSFFDTVLDQVTLSDLAKTEQEAKKRMEVFAKLEAEKIRSRFCASSAENVNLEKATAGDWK